MVQIYCKRSEATWLIVIIEYIKDILHFRDLISTIYQEWINKNRAFVYIPDPMALPLEYWLGRQAIN